MLRYTFIGSLLLISQCTGFCIENSRGETTLEIETLYEDDIKEEQIMPSW
jgi:hypothetical protein